MGVANVVTSVVGALVQVIDYFPFGSVRVDDKSSTYDSTQKFTGHELDDDTGLYYAQARYYDSEIGRFISQDPLQMRLGELMKGFSKSPQALNFYSYTVNNPLTFVDPDGEKVTLVGRAINTSSSAKWTSKLGQLGVHTFLLIQPDNPDDFAGVENFTLGAYEKNGMLIKAINDPSDANANPELMTKGDMIINAPEGKSDSQFISDILNSYGSYSDDKSYPKMGLGTNSNSFMMGMLMGAGVDESILEQYDPNGIQPGWYPIPEMMTPDSCKEIDLKSSVENSGDKSKTTD